MKSKLLRTEDCEPNAPGAVLTKKCRKCGKDGIPALDKICPRCKSAYLLSKATLPGGAIIDHPDAWQLVRAGVAVPEDDECREACGMSEVDMADAQYAQKRIAAGIHPDDYALYDAGVIAGYTPSGEYLPGPNYDEIAAAEERSGLDLSAMRREAA